MLRALALVFAVCFAAAPASAAQRGPGLTEPPAERLAALNCYGELATSPRAPVLLVPGTLTSPEEAWSWGYQKVLLERGHSVCTVRLPGFGFGDAQRSVEYVITAIREVTRRGGRRLSVIGHSQGSFQPLFALRVWPRVARYVDDFIGLAGAYDRGSHFAREQLDPSTRTPASRPFCSEDCVPWYHQLATGSKLLRELGRRRLPAAPSYTAIGTLYDEYHTPQPEANELPRGAARRSMQIQDVCPGRRYPSPVAGVQVNHGGMLGDAVGHALVLDALEHPGPADPDRIPRSACLELVYEEFDPVGFAVAAAGFGPRFAERQDEVESEPPLRCALDPRCEDRRSWAVPLLDSARLTPAAIRAVRHCPGGCERPHTAVLRLTVRAPGWLRLRLHRLGSGQDVVRVIRGRLRLSEGRRSIHIDARGCREGDRGTSCLVLRPGAYRLDLETKPIDGSYWTRERALGLRATRR